MQKGLNITHDSEYGISVAQLYDTRVVRIDHNNHTVTLCTGGWVTASTAKAMNTMLTKYGISFRVFRRKGVMYVHNGTKEPIEIDNVLHLGVMQCLPLY